jgi:hypothetical protein
MLVPIIHANGDIDEVNIPSNSSLCCHLAHPTSTSIEYYKRHSLSQRNYFNNTYVIVHVYINENFFKNIKLECRNEMIENYLKDKQLYIGSYGERTKCL